MIDLKIHTQPNDETCGPTSLHSIYKFYGLDIPLEEVIQGVDKSLSGGTLTPMLGVHALQNNFQTRLYIYNLNLFDPSWFENSQINNQLLIDKLTAQMEYKNDPHITKATLAYVDYLKLGGILCMDSLNVDLLKKYFKRKLPILTALSATYLYRSSREYFTPEGKSVYDDIRGTPCGHFVVLCGYDEKKRLIVVADPHAENPLSHNNYYKVSINRLINSIMLGVLTYDANLLIIEPKEI
jgi:hypothetical protein